MRLTPRRVAIAVCATLAVAVWLTRVSIFGPSQRDSPSYRHLDSSILASRRQIVLDAFRHAWTGYSMHCFGKDALHPVSNTCDNDFGGWGATAIDALSTAIMLGENEIATQILQFVAQIDFTKVDGGTKIQLFEVTIRHLAGLISAYDLLHGPFAGAVRDEALIDSLYVQMVKLGDALACAFDSPSGVPRNWVDPKLCKSDDGTSNTVASIGTLILEFSRLSNLTANPMYARLARRAESFLLTPQPSEGEPYPGLLGSFVNVQDGRFVSSKGSWGSLADSFYEYLLKAYVYDSEEFPFYLERWQVAADSTMRYIGSHPYGHPEWTLLPYWENGQLYNAMDSLSWFAGGNFIYGGMVTGNDTLVNYGLSFANAAAAIYSSTLTGLGGEYTSWTTDCSSDWAAQCTAANSVSLSDGTFRLRPEVLETWYYAFRATRKPQYREFAWDTFEAVLKYCKTPSGFSGLQDVNLPNGGERLDVMESFLFAETMKYIWLLHLEDEQGSIQVQDSRTGKFNNWVFNTEAHPLRVVGTPV